jgi:hypothetical protein
MMSCKEAVQLMSEEMERNLGLGERLALRFHQLICQGCRNYRQQMLFLREICKSYLAHGDVASQADDVKD